MDLIIVRHGQSVADIERRMEGRTDFPLTELGIDQARKASEWIVEHYSPDYIFASPLSRACKTAEIIGLAAGVKVTVDEDLIDWNHGVLAGMLIEEANAKYPEKPEGRFPHEAIEGGESDLSIRFRAENFISRITNNTEYKGKTLLVVTHTMVINNLFAAFFEIPAKQTIRIKTDDTGIHHWKIQGPYKVILSSNSMEHLANYPTTEGAIAG
jgi:Fructose-2,6-bisphosphatase